MAYEARAIITNKGKQYTAEMWAYGSSFEVKYFAITAGGHDPTDPTTALTIDPAATVMPGEPWLFGLEAIDSIEWETDICPTFVCTIEQGELVGSLSSVGLYGEVVYSPARPAGAPPAPTIGETFLFAVYNRSRLTLTGTDGPTTFKLTPYL